ncbi:hypothetical protein EB796_024885 [Bugula neritina]|uniref:Uncharacterized protein n=1 Tax=Bugula neritina TaxID=10212 RepID=A0A7J7ITS0_BUGNE|nr:hypothetical protein EB796_024885 [Bugula neritina]
MSITAANAFRYEEVQQLILLKTHHALNWDMVQLIDMFTLGQRWLKDQYKNKPSYRYPVITWDLLPPSGASQYHPHLQAILTPHHYPGNLENWRRAAFDYHRDHGRNFFTDFISVHDMLGLTVRHGSAVAIATLVNSKKENEVVVMAKEMNKDYLQLLYAVLRSYIDDMQLYSFCLSMALTPFADDPSTDRYYTPVKALPVFTRVVTRGKLSDTRSDISSLELFTFSNVNSDPFSLIQRIQESVLTRVS